MQMSFAPHIAKSLAQSIERTNHLSVISASVTAIELGLGTTVFKVTLNDVGMWNCTDGCGKGMYKGRPCVHLLKTFHLQGMDLFQPGYIHNHWKVQTNYDFDKIQAAFKSKVPMNYLSSCNFILGGVPNIASISKTSCRGEREPGPKACLELMECWTGRPMLAMMAA
jgi:hypothetical protein